MNNCLELYYAILLLEFPEHQSSDSFEKMGNSLRNQPFPSLFSEVKTPVSIDMQQARIYVCLGIIAFSFFLILPGIRGLEVRKYW